MTNKLALAAVAALGALVLAGCGSSGESKTPEGAAEKLEGKVVVDGSSTVFPISEAVAEEFMKENPGVRVTVGISGTGGGFKKFAVGEIDISDASRPIDPAERDAAQKNGIEFIELPVAFDGLSVVVNPGNDWVDYLTVAELKAIWEPGSKITNWNQVRPTFPDRPLKLYGAGTDSGTFDYFTKAIVGEEKASRSDYQASEDDNSLVTGVSGDANALGYFGYAYYSENKDKLKLVPVKNGDADPVAPSPETIGNGTYQPLSRPEFIYVNAEAAKRPEIIAFVRFYLGEVGQALVSEVGYVPLAPEDYKLAFERFETGKTGTAFDGPTVGVKFSDSLKR